MEQFNGLCLHEFSHRFWPSDVHFKPNKASSPQSWLLNIESSSTISPQDLHACFQLISDTSSEQYAASSFGWHPAKKRKEMRLPDMKYILVKSNQTLIDTKADLGTIEGFMSFMLTYEDGIEVVYCYEIHLGEKCRGMGLGKCMIGCLEEVGRKAGVKKMMLTVFKVNEMARAFYGRLGYEEDEYSPRPKKLRGGVVKEADYMILSKPLLDNQVDSGSETGVVNSGDGASKDDRLPKRKAG